MPVAFLLLWVEEFSLLPNLSNQGPVGKSAGKGEIGVDPRCVAGTEVIKCIWDVCVFLQFEIGDPLRKRLYSNLLFVYSFFLQTYFFTEEWSMAVNALLTAARWKARRESAQVFLAVQVLCRRPSIHIPYYQTQHGIAATDQARAGIRLPYRKRERRASEQ